MVGKRQTEWPEDYLRPDALAPAGSGRALAPARPSLWWEILETVLLTLVLFVLVRTLVLNFKVEGQSMAPALANGQFLLVNRALYTTVDGPVAAWLPGEQPCQAGRCYLFRPPARGDIIVFWPPGGTDKPYIKRVIGLPGETVEVRDGAVLVNGAPLAEPYIVLRAGYSARAMLVPEGQLYVLGDNRNNSSDSHLFGMLPSEQIIGQAWLSYWPSATWGVLPTPAYAASE